MLFRSQTLPNPARFCQTPPNPTKPYQPLPIPRQTLPNPATPSAINNHMVPRQLLLKTSMAIKNSQNLPGARTLGATPSTIIWSQTLPNLVKPRQALPNLPTPPKPYQTLSNSARVGQTPPNQARSTNPCLYVWNWFRIWLFFEF